jgi:ParB/RepB/Spo0J family partition protein
MNTTKELPIDALEPSRTNPRRTMDKSGVSELAASIRANGLLQPLLVRPIADANGKYEVVCGNRRLVALRESGVQQCAVTIRDLSDDEAADAQQVENLQREDVPPLEEGEAFTALVKKHGLDNVAARIGKTTAFIRRRMMLTRLTGTARKLLQNGTLPIKAAELIAAVEDDAIRKRLCDGIDDRGITPGEVADYLQRSVLQRLSGAPFDKTKVYSCPHEDGRVCADCPFNTGAAKGQLFPELAKEARCLNSKCFQAKADAEFKVRADAHVAKGGGTLGEKDAKRCWPHSHGYFDSSHFVPLDNLRQPGKAVKFEIAKKDILIVQNPHTKHSYFVVPRPVADAIRKRVNGDAKSQNGAEDSHRQERRRQRIEGEKRKQLRIAYAKAFGKVAAIEAKVYPALATALAGRLSYDQWRVVLAARGIDRPKGMTWEQERRFEKKLVGGLAKSQVAGFVLQCVAIMADPFSVDAPTRALAAAAGLNRRKIEQAVDDAIKEQFTAPKPHAAKAVASVRSRSSQVSRTIPVAGRAA